MLPGILNIDTHAGAAHGSQVAAGSLLGLVFTLMALHIVTKSGFAVGVHVVFSAPF